MINTGVGRFGNELQAGGVSYLNYVITKRGIGLNAFKAILLGILCDQDGGKNVRNIVACFLRNVGINLSVV